MVTNKYTFTLWGTVAHGSPESSAAAGEGRAIIQECDLSKPIEALKALWVDVPVNVVPIAAFVLQFIRLADVVQAVENDPAAAESLDRFFRKAKKTLEDIYD